MIRHPVGIKDPLKFGVQVGRGERGPLPTLEGVQSIHILLCLPFLPHLVSIARARRSLAMILDYDSQLAQAM